MVLLGPGCCWAHSIKERLWRNEIDPFHPELQVPAADPGGAPGLTPNTAQRGGELGRRGLGAPPTRAGPQGTGSVFCLSLRGGL